MQGLEGSQVQMLKRFQLKFFWFCFSLGLLKNRDIIFNRL